MPLGLEYYDKPTTEPLVGSTATVKETIEEACKRYIAVLNSPPNANGRRFDAKGTPAWRIRGQLVGLFGEAELTNTLRSLFAKASRQDADKGIRTTQQP